MSDPANPTQVGYFRVPSGTTGVTSGSASATYWHKGYVYVADYNRGIDVLKFDGTITGTPDGDLLGRLRRREGHLLRDGRRGRRAARCRRR